MQVACQRYANLSRQFSLTRSFAGVDYKKILFDNFYIFRVEISLTISSGVYRLASVLLTGLVFRSNFFLQKWLL